MDPGALDMGSADSGSDIDELCGFPRISTAQGNEKTQGIASLRHHGPGC